MIFKIPKSHILKEWEAFKWDTQIQFWFNTGAKGEKKNRNAVKQTLFFSYHAFQKNKIWPPNYVLIWFKLWPVIMSTLHYKVALSDHTDVTGCGTSGSPEIPQLEQTCALGSKWMRRLRAAGQNRLQTWACWKSDTLSNQKQKQDREVEGLAWCRAWRETDVLVRLMHLGSFMRLYE